jgi:hypothetical protein
VCCGMCAAVVSDGAVGNIVAPARSAVVMHGMTFGAWSALCRLRAL